MSLNILVLDDRYASSDIVAYLEDFGYCVYWAKEYLSANYYIDVEPGILSFSGMIIDLDIPYNENDFTEKEHDVLRKYPVNVSGWLWIKNVLKMHDYLGDIIILSGHHRSIIDDELKDYEGRITYISKSDSMALKHIERVLKKETF